MDRVILVLPRDSKGRVTRVFLLPRQVTKVYNHREAWLHHLGVFLHLLEVWLNHLVVCNLH
jgi:hypothetical protein